MPSFAKMSDARPVRESTSPDAVGVFVEAYESALLEGPADLQEFLPSGSDELYPAVLRELIRVDLEQSRERGRARRLEEYRTAFPALFRDRTALQELAFEEYRLRLQAGEKPSPEEYHDRFQVNTDGWPRTQDPTTAAVCVGDGPAVGAGAGSGDPRPALAGSGDPRPALGDPRPALALMRGVWRSWRGWSS
jgi:hypothetical protein